MHAVCYTPYFSRLHMVLIYADSGRLHRLGRGVASDTGNQGTAFLVLAYSLEPLAYLAMFRSHLSKETS